MFADVISVVAPIVFLVRLLPQPARLARSGVAEGVSPLAALNGLVAAVAWLVYGLVAGEPAVWIVSLVAVVPGVWTVALLGRRTTRSDLTWSAAWVLALSASAVVGLLGLALGLGVLVTQGPQVVRALREDDLDGIAPATWWISIADAATWGAYGVVKGDAALMGYAVVLSSCSVVVLARLWWTAPGRRLTYRRSGEPRRPDGRIVEVGEARLVARPAPQPPLGRP